MCQVLLWNMANDVAYWTDYESWRRDVFRDYGKLLYESRAI